MVTVVTNNTPQQIATADFELIRGDSYDGQVQPSISLVI